MDLRNEKIITQVADCFRQELSVDRVVLAMLLLAWQKVSHDPRCPSNLRMDVCRGQVPTGVADVLTQLGRILNIDAFSAEATRPLSRLSESTLMNAISTCLQLARDRKSTRLNSSHLVSTYSVLCLKKKIKATFCYWTMRIE